jgi:hypothetical protein
MDDGAVGTAGTNLVPWNLENRVLLNNPCTACPNARKKVMASAALK